MGSLGGAEAELSLDFWPTSMRTEMKKATTVPFVPRTITDFLKEVSMIADVAEKASRLDAFVQGLEEEMRKIDAFKRELPLCMLLLNDAILVLKQETTQCEATRFQQPKLEEFIPLKKNSDHDDNENDDNDEDDDRTQDGVIKQQTDSNRDKKNWMSSVQLWNTDDIFDGKQNIKLETKTSKRENEYANGDLFQPHKSRTAARAFMPFKACSVLPRKQDGGREELPVPGLSLVTPGIKNLKEESGSTGSRNSCSRTVSSSAPNLHSNLRNGPQSLQQQASRKQRRCWSPDLHRRFVSALEHLGGSQAATPKQIRELMQVDGLTNDEVKSHLQKYRLHTRRTPPVATTPAHQSVVVLGGLLMSQDQCGDSLKGTSSLSGSPQGPFQLAGNTGGTSTTGGDSMEDDEDAKSESYSWKSHIHRSGKDDV